MLAAVIAVLVFVSVFLNSEIRIGNYKTKKISLFDDILQKEVYKKYCFVKTAITDSLVFNDSVQVMARAADPVNIEDVQLSDSVSVLTTFFEALNELKKKKRKVRIAYFGDSMIEGDLISQDLRMCFQNNFGGDGVGFVPVTSVVAGFRTSVTHSFSGWTTYNLLEDAPKSHSLGIAGYCFVPAQVKNIDTENTKLGSYVKYTAVNKKHIDKFSEIKILYGQAKEDNKVIINGKAYELSGDKTVNQLIVKNTNDIKSVTAYFQCKEPVDVFGVTMESDSGVFVDNFSFRGNSGMPLIKISKEVFKETQECLQYDLIILEYGLNAVSSKCTDYSWYARGMNAVIKHLKECFPETSIILVSVGDKGYRNNGKYETDPGVFPMLATQKKLAKENKLAFWSLFDAMGGEGSMVKWVEGDTVMANKDYTHFNFRGAHKIGTLFYEKLMSEYKDYNKTH